MSKSATQSMSKFAILSTSNNVTLFMMKFVTVHSLAMEEMVEALEVLVEIPVVMLEVLSLDMVQLQPHLVDKYQDKNVRMSQDNSAKMFLASSVNRYQPESQKKSARIFLVRCATMYLDKNVEMYQDSSARMCLDKSATMSPGKSAIL